MGQRECLEWADAFILAQTIGQSFLCEAIIASDIVKKAQLGSSLSTHRPYQQSFFSKEPQFLSKLWGFQQKKHCAYGLFPTYISNMYKYIYIICTRNRKYQKYKLDCTVCREIIQFFMVDRKDNFAYCKMTSFRKSGIKMFYSLEIGTPPP